MNRSRPRPNSTNPRARKPAGTGVRRPFASRETAAPVSNAAGHVATQLAREYWDELSNPRGRSLTAIMRSHPQEVGLLNDFQKYRLRSYLESLARWHGWLKGHTQRFVEWPLLLGAILESDKVDDTHRAWARRCDLSPERLLALGDAPNWTARGEGYRRLVGSNRANVDPWALVPGWLRTHLPEVPSDESAKNWHSRILEGFQQRPFQWIRLRDVLKNKTVEQTLEKLTEAVGQAPWRSRKMTTAVRWPRYIDLPEQKEPWPWIAQDFSDQVIAQVCDPDPGERWCVVDPQELAIVIDFADRMKGKGLVVVASGNERLLKAAALLARRCGCHNINTRAMTGDVIPGKSGTYDGVLIHEAGMGMDKWRTDPERRIRSDERDLKGVVSQIDARLRAGQKAVKTGGRLVYAVGSLTKDETDSVADRLLKEFPHLVPQEFVDPRTGELGTARLHNWPERDFGEALFVTRWTKSGSSHGPSA